MKDQDVAPLSPVQQICNILAGTWSSGHVVLQAVNVSVRPSEFKYSMGVSGASTPARLCCFLGMTCRTVSEQYLKTSFPVKEFEL